jgi:tetratricopeptide (TPR) repeat protein
MKLRLYTACTVLTLLAHSACADGLTDAKAGLEALNRGDNGTAIALFTKAITGGALSRADKELAYVKRSEAYLATGSKDKALADAQKALVLEPSDAEAAGVRDKAQGVGNGPSLAVTMQFIQDTLNDIGDVHFVTSDLQPSTDKTWQTRFGAQLSSVRADASTCVVGYYFELRSGAGDFFRRGDYQLRLANAQNVVVEPFTRYWSARYQLLGFEDRIVTPMDLEPTMLAIHNLHTNVNSDNWFLFNDADLADRVAKAITHAIELCGGGNKDPF